MNEIKIKCQIMSNDFIVIQYYKDDKDFSISIEEEGEQKTVIFDKESAEKIINFIRSNIK